MAALNIQWHYIPLELGDTPARLQPKLAQAGLSSEALSRSVYVIRLNEPFSIHYPTDASPVLYIGEGDFVARISAHGRSWLQNLSELVEQFGMHVAVATPRVRNNANAYRDVEAILINEFAARFGSAPLNNKQYEYARVAHDYDLAQIREPLLRGKGSRYKWAVRPLRSNEFSEVYERTHLG